MKSLKKTVLSWIAAAVLSGFAAAHAQAETMNWANSVTSYSANIQNYGGTLMDTSTTWWVTGLPDADADGNGYVWDPGDHDYVAGWRSNAPGESIILHWDSPIADLPGNDLVAYLYSGPQASATVSASVDGAEFTQIGTIGGGTAGYLRQEEFDFAGLGPVSYVKVLRVANGSQTGTFFDAFGGTNAVPEPGAIALLATGAIALFALRRGIRRSKD